MNKQFKLAPLAIAVASLCFATTTVANDEGGSHHKGKWHKKFAEATAVVNDEQDSDYNLVDSTALDNEATMNGHAMGQASGNLGVNIGAGDNNVQGNSAALAAADASFVFGGSTARVRVDQNAEVNDTINLGVVNSAKMAGSAMRNASGNIGVNIGAGNSNVQKNAFAGTVSPGFKSEARVAVDQETENNITSNLPLDEIITTTTSVSISGGMKGGYYGGGVGVYEGYESGKLGFRESGKLGFRESGKLGFRESGSVEGRYYGSGSGQYSGKTGGTYEGVSDQWGDVYPDIWRNSENEFEDGQHHVHGNNVRGIFGHMDLDTRTEGGRDLNDDGGALAFKENGEWSGREHGKLNFKESGKTKGKYSGSGKGHYSGYGKGSYSGKGRGHYSGKEEGKLGFREAGKQSLSGSFSGEVVHNQRIYIRPKNEAHMGGNALNNGSGNIGVNIAAGTNNLQNNSLAISNLQDSELVPTE